MLICALVLCACATVPKTAPAGLAGCTDVGPIVYDPRNDVVSETRTMGPSQVIWIHPPETMSGHFIEAYGHVYRCPSAAIGKT
jgi:hypothetical protein